MCRDLSSDKDSSTAGGGDVEFSCDEVISTEILVSFIGAENTR